MRYAAKVDANQPLLVAALRRAGYHVTLLHRVGGGVPDLLVTGVKLPAGDVAALLVEVKQRGEQLTLPEQAYHATFPDRGPLIVAYEAEDVLAWFGR